MFSFADAELACDGVVCIEDAMEELESVSTWLRFGKKYASYYGLALRYGQVIVLNGYAVVGSAAELFTTDEGERDGWLVGHLIDKFA